MLRICWEIVGAADGQHWASSQGSSTMLLFKTLFLCYILRCWHIKTKLLDHAQNLRLCARIKCSFFGRKKNVPICHRISSNLELTWMNCVNETIMALLLLPPCSVLNPKMTIFDAIHCFGTLHEPFADLGSHFLGGQTQDMAHSLISNSNFKLSFIADKSLDLIYLMPLLSKFHLCSTFPSKLLKTVLRLLCSERSMTNTCNSKSEILSLKSIWIA